MSWFLLAVAAAIVNIALADLFGWFPRLAERIIEAAARRLPADSRTRYREEWLAELEVLPGGGISALIFAARVLLRCRRVSHAVVDAPQDARRRVRSDLAQAALAHEAPAPAPASAPLRGCSGAARSAVRCSGPSRVLVGASCARRWTSCCCVSP